MNPDNITRAMSAVIRATSATSDWNAQRKLLAAYDRLAEARRAAWLSAGIVDRLNDGAIHSTKEQTMRTGGGA